MTEEPNNSGKEKWYYKKSAVVTAFLLVGPLALPLVWINPKYGKVTKVIITVVVAAASVLLMKMFLQSLETIKSLSGSYEQFLK
ncbi:MAG: hypothetical protein PHN57_01665 [Candidatus Omnitrophica bacterium]|nr:hypothetical protein [Candidatus Omnitrophota bacterium]